MCVYLGETAVRVNNVLLLLLLLSYVYYIYARGFTVGELRLCVD